jgi:Pentapeptide repeats (8 copies)
MEAAMQFEIKNRTNGAGLFTVTLDDKFEQEPRSIQLREAFQLAKLARMNTNDADFSGVDLRGFWLYNQDLCGIDFSDADLRDVDFRRAELSLSIFTGAVFSPELLATVPFIEDIHRRVYEAASKRNAFSMRTWHSQCGTQHCRGGLVIHLAGEAGSALETRLGPKAAASLIYLMSDPDIEEIPEFYASNEDALADMKHLAEREAQTDAPPSPYILVDSEYV